MFRISAVETKVADVGPKSRCPAQRPCKQFSVFVGYELHGFVKERRGDSSPFLAHEQEVRRYPPPTLRLDASVGPSAVFCEQVGYKLVELWLQNCVKDFFRELKIHDSFR